MDPESPLKTRFLRHSSGPRRILLSSDKESQTYGRTDETSTPPEANTPSSSALGAISTCSSPKGDHQRVKKPKKKRKSKKAQATSTGPVGPVTEAEAPASSQQSQGEERREPAVGNFPAVAEPSLLNSDTGTSHISATDCPSDSPSHMV